MQAKKYTEKGLDISKLDFLLHRINRLEATLSPVGLEKSDGSKSRGNKDSSPGAVQGGGKGPVDDPLGLTSVGTS